VVDQELVWDYFNGIRVVVLYKLYNPVSQKLVMTRDLIVDESKGWSWESTIENDKVCANST